MKTTRLYITNDKVFDFTFIQNKDDFIVEEIPLYTFSNSGNFLILKIKKIYTSTWELITHISNTLDISEHQIGYAGLKDKNATTTQYISIPLNKSRDFKLIETKNIKVLDTFKNNRMLKKGDLKANQFQIILKDIKPEDLPFIYQRISQIQKRGIPNYFGFQRFGKENNFQKAKDIVYGEIKHSDKKLESFMKISYQSYFFNAWLAKRVELSIENDSKVLYPLDGDIYNKNKIITGLMPGRKVLRAKLKASEIEQEFDDLFIHEKGLRRDAWIQPTNIQNKYLSDTNSMKLKFTLPKSSYATVFIENIANKNYNY